MKREYTIVFNDTDNAIKFLKSIRKRDIEIDRIEITLKIDYRVLGGLKTHIKFRAKRLLVF